MGSHRCAIPRCPEKIGPALLMCRDHWYEVPKDLRDEVWAQYRAEGVWSERYMAARDAAIESITGEAVD